MKIEQLRFLNIAFEDCSIDNSSEIVEDFCAGERKTCSLILMKAQNFKETGLYFLGTPRNYIIFQYQHSLSVIAGSSEFRIYEL